MSGSWWQGSHIFKRSILGIELNATWAGITCVRQELQVEKILLESDYVTIIGWIRYEAKYLEVDSNLRDIWSFLGHSIVVSIWCIFRKVYSVANWVTSFMTVHTRIGPSILTMFVLGSCKIFCTWVV